MLLLQILFILNLKNDRMKQTLIECLQHHLEEERDGGGIRSSARSTVTRIKIIDSNVKKFA